MKLTSNELIVLRAIDRSEYGDAITDRIWTFSVADHAKSLKRTSLPGIVSSLVKKGAVQVGGFGAESDINMTDAGATAYAAALAALNQKPNKHFN